MLRSPTVALVALAAACSPNPDAGSTDAVTIRDSAGVEIVENHRPLLADSAWQLTPEPVLSLPDSVATGGAPYVQAGFRLLNGDIVVTTGQPPVRWFDSTGMPKHVIGGPGQGPGEVRYVADMVRMAGDTVMLSEGWYRNRSSLYAPTGDHVGDEPFDLDRLQKLGRWQECHTMLLPDRSRIGCQDDSTLATSETNRHGRMLENGEYRSPGPGLLRSLSRFYIVPPTVDTALPLGVEAGIEQFLVERGGGQLESVMHPFYGQTQIIAGGEPMRVAIATNPEWVVELWTAEGLLERIIRLDGGRRAPTVVEATAARQLAREWMVRVTSRRTQPIDVDGILSRVPEPDSIAAIRGLVLSREGDLAVTRGGMFAVGFPTTIDFFDPRGRWLATKEMPARWRLLDFGEDYLLGVRQDEDDLPHLELYGLKRGP